MQKNFISLILIQTIYLSTLQASQGFYIGTDFGLSNMSGKRNDSATDNPPHDPSLTTNLSFNKKTQTNSINGGIFAGYLFRMKNFGIGPELFYNYGKLENSIVGQHVNGPIDTTIAFNVKYRSTTQIGTNVRFGYFFDKYFFYGLLGVQIKTNQFYAQAQRTTIGDPMTIHSYKSKRKRASAFTFGIGTQKTISEHYDIGLECKIGSFPKKNFTWNLQDPSSTVITSSFKYQLRSISLKLMYVF